MVLNAATRIGPDGIGLARGPMRDVGGLIGEIAQRSLMAPRG
jgi:hypothetical protein